MLAQFTYCNYNIFVVLVKIVHTCGHYLNSANCLVTFYPRPFFGNTDLTSRESIFMAKFGWKVSYNFLNVRRHK